MDVLIPHPASVYTLGVIFLPLGDALSPDSSYVSSDTTSLGKGRNSSPLSNKHRSLGFSQSLSRLCFWGEEIKRKGLVPACDDPRLSSWPFLF